MASLRTWRLAATHSHLYPGAVLREPDGPAAQGRWRAGDAVLLEFSDGAGASGELQEVEPASVRLHVQAYRTARRTPIAAKAWLLHWDGEGRLKVHARIAQ